MALNVGEKIRGIRNLKGFSQEYMAQALDMSLRSYSNLEREEVDMTLSRLEQVAGVLGVSASDILGFGEWVSNFFEHCGSPSVHTGGSASYSHTNNYDAREL